MRTLRALPVLVLLSLILSGCADRLYSNKTIIEWSRGKQLGAAALSEPVAMRVAPDGHQVVLAWIESPERGAFGLRFVVMDNSGIAVVDRELPVAVDEPTNLHLVLTEGENAHLFWLDKRGYIESLFDVQVGLDGTMLTPPRQLSDPEFRVNGTDVLTLPSGEILVLWSNRSAMRAAMLGEENRLDVFDVVEAPGITALDASIDASGVVHLAWQAKASSTERRVLYATLDTSTGALSDRVTLATIALQAGSSLRGSGDELYGPILSLTDNQIVVSWSVGQSRGSNESISYVSFSPSEFGDLVPTYLALPAAYFPDYSPAQGAWPYVQMAPTLPEDAQFTRTPFHSAPATVDGQSPEISLAVTLWLRTQWGAQLQPALVVFDQGQAKGFQVVNWSRFPSMHPTLAADANGQLYMSWIDAQGKTFAVYVASTTPGFKDAWDSITRADLSISIERLIGRFLSSLGLAVVGASWLILPGFFLLVSLFFLREDSLQTTRGKVVLLLLIVLHWAGKFLLTPGVLGQLPRLSDLPQLFPMLTLLAPGTFAYLANQLQLPAIGPLIPYLIPSITLVFGAMVMRIGYSGRKRYPNVILAYVILATADVLLSLQVYSLTYYDPSKF